MQACQVILPLHAHLVWPRAQPVLALACRRCSCPQLCTATGYGYELGGPPASAYDAVLVLAWDQRIPPTRCLWDFKE